MSTVTFTQVLDSPIDHVWEVHQRPGIVTRLMPGFSRFRTVQQASDLRDGTTLFSLPAGLQWNSTHDSSAFRGAEPEEGNHPVARYFTDVCVSPVLGRLTGWRHEHRFTPLPDGRTLLTDKVTVNLPRPLAKRALRRVFAFRHNRLQEDLARMEEWSSEPQTIAVTGSSGLVGTQLCALLELAGHHVIRMKRDELERDLRGVDAVVHLGGHPIAGRFTDEHLEKVRSSRITPTRILANNAARCGVKTFVCASAVGFYGYARGCVADETAPQGDGELASIVADWEAASQHPDMRVVNVRSGLVLAGGSPMLDLLTASVRVGGGALGGGDQHFAWVGLDDVVDVYFRSIFDANLSGPINAVGPESHTQAEFSRELARVAHGVALVPVPRQAPALLLGKRGAKELALADQNVEPAVLQRIGHRFRHPTLRAALEHEFGISPE